MVTKVFEISMNHVSERTRKMLKKYGDASVIPVYTRDFPGHGLESIIRVDGFIVEEVWDTYDDLRECIKMARDYGCKWLCLSRDGKVVEGLKVYE